METLKIKRLHPNAVIPKRMTEGAAGVDLTATDLELEILPDAGGKEYSRAAYKYTYSTGLAFEIPEGYVGLIFPRSSIHKTDMTLTNAVGVIDSDYRGEVKFVFKMYSHGQKVYEIGDRIGQLVLMKLPEFEIQEVTELSTTERSVSGFGSTDR